MPKERKLNGKGEFIYDYNYDILTFKVKNRNYKKSVKLQNFIIDIDNKDFVTGVRIFDASKVLSTKKIILNNIVDGSFQARMENNVITITLKFIGKIRNKLIPIFGKNENFSQQLTTVMNKKDYISDSLVECPIIA